MLDPADRWIWDFWHTQDGAVHHLFYLQAPKSLVDAQLRHRYATIGHATSTDLSRWTEHGTVLAPGGEGTADATATWTGSVVRGDDGLWWMFYTGTTFLSDDNDRNLQVITAAVSADLYQWRKDPSVLIRPDPSWYERLGDSTWPEQAWRDPWVYRDSAGLWNMLVTARSNTGAIDDRGVIAHVTSPDLLAWTVQPPMTSPGAGFAQLEVPQSISIGNRPYLLFSTHQTTLTLERQQAGGTTGTWIAPIHNGVRLDQAFNLTGPDVYSGRCIHRDGTAVLLAFHATDRNGAFAGGITDPIGLSVEDGRPALLFKRIDAIEQ